MENIKEISPQKDKFLKRTAIIDNPAKHLWYIGAIPKPGPAVAIVGSRKPTAYGRAVNQQITNELAKHGVIIVSGLALGHDGLAHRTCLDAGGITIAVQGNGLSKIYPSRNDDLAKRIIDNHGLIVSEYPPAAPVYPNQFLERNRLISALADIVVVIEAGERSGTLNTASHAIAQGKDVMAVPGNITSPLSKGCNRLIANGATPILSAHDILDRLNIVDSKVKQQATKIRFDSPDSQTIYDLILSGITDGEELLAKSQLGSAEFSNALTMLELNGYIQALGGNKWSAR